MTRAQLTTVREALKRLREHSAQFENMPRGWRCRCINCRDDLDAMADNLPAVLEWVGDAAGEGGEFDHVGSKS